MPPPLSPEGSLGPADVLVVPCLQGGVVRPHIHSSPVKVVFSFLKGTNDGILFFFPGAPIDLGPSQLGAVGLWLPSSPTCCSTAPTAYLLALVST